MNLYKALGSAVGTRTALDLAQRLSAWHDAMVVHQRRAGSSGDGCDSECPHSEAPLLWLEALDVYGARAHELAFLRTHAEADRDGAGATALEASL